MGSRDDEDPLMDKGPMDEFTVNYESTKKRMMMAVSAPVFDELEKLKQEVEFKKRALKQKEVEAVQSQLDSIEQTKRHYKELLV